MGSFLGENGKKWCFVLLFGAGLFLALKYVFPLLAPFLLAFLAVYCNFPWLKKGQEKLHIKKEILLGGLLLTVAAAAIAGICMLVSAGTAHAAQIGSGIRKVTRQADSMTADCCRFLEQRFGMEAGHIQFQIEEKMEDFAEQMQTDFVPKAAEQSLACAKGFLSAAAFVGISFIAALLFCKDYERILQRIEENEFAEALWQFTEKTVGLIGGYLKAQGVILLVIFLIAAGGLFLGRIKGALLWGLLAGFLDALPFLGTGLVLLSAALWQLMNGNFYSAGIAAVTYVLCLTARELLEPRLLGRQTGIYPVVMLLSVYAGVKVFGLTGIFLGPLYAVLFREGTHMIFRENS